MTQLIVLVEDAADVGTAIAGGARRIVVRAARVDATPAADLARFTAIGAAAAGRCAMSLWHPAAGSELPAAVAACGADEVWGPLAAEPLPGVSRWAVIAPADMGGVVASQGAAGIVISGGNGPPRLLQSIAIDGLDAQVRQVRALGLAVRIAGSMEAPDVPRLLLLEPAALVGGDLVRSDGVLDVEKVRLAIDLLATARSPHYDGGSVAPSNEPDRIFVRDWTVPLQVGAYGHERAPQRVRFNVEAEVARTARRAADMRDVVTYDLITDAIARATVAHVSLVETIAEDVAALMLAHPRVMAVDITVEKLDLGPGSLGCRIRRRRAPT